MKRLIVTCILFFLVPASVSASNITTCRWAPQQYTQRLVAYAKDSFITTRPPIAFQAVIVGRPSLAARFLPSARMGIMRPPHK